MIVDIDGTLAIITDRNPYDTRGVLKDKPHHPVIEVTRALHAAGHRIVIVSGRAEQARADTETWLARHLALPFDGPHLRADGDDRKDAVVKREIYRKLIQPQFDVLCVLDDRNPTVRAWRELGLTCLQVAPGDF